MAAERIGRYLLDDVIGVGSFATVHRARDERLDDTVVVKVLAENHSLNPEIRERFIAEGRNLRRVYSPHVVAVHDLGESSRQQPYLVLEYADRGTLADRVQALRRTGWTAAADDVLVLARSLAAALEAVHEAHLVHRDLSPANVLLRSAARTSYKPGTSGLVSDDEQVLLADLGMCKDLALNSGLTVAGGTSGFRPPEQHTTAVIDARADVWALSALVVWLCEGADLPSDLATALQRSLAEAPSERNQDVASWLHDVEKALAPPPPLSTIEAQDHPGSAGDSDLATTSPRSRGRIAAVLVALLLIGALGGGLLAREMASPVDATSRARIDIEGPAEVRVGESATYTARHTGVESWVWVLPTGAYVSDVATITLSPTGVGRAELLLRSRDADGTDLVVSHAISVTP